ncbi:hypothetical protein ACFWIA_33885 [Streptomyces sp. NPDC127068]
MIVDLYERLLAAADARSEDGADRVRATYEPTDGLSGKIYPPTVLNRM